MEITEKTSCPICGKDCETSKMDRTRVYFYDCSVCGKYAMPRTDELKLNLSCRSKDDKAKISAYTRERHIHDMPIVSIVSETQKTQSMEGPVVSIENILKDAFPRNVSDRLDRSLKNLQ